LFYEKDKKSREAAFEENDIGIEKDERNKIIETLKNNKFKISDANIFTFQLSRK